jgi:hypothetical protein
MRPTEQKIALAEYVAHAMAADVMMYPNKLSSGTRIPISDVRQRGSRQYPSVEAERANVSVELKCLLPPE